MSKTCDNCNEQKPLESFSKRGNKTTCKDCKKEIVKENKRKTSALAREKVREKLNVIHKLEKTGKCCPTCGK